MRTLSQKTALFLWLLVAASRCHGANAAQGNHSSSIAVSADGSTLFVANPDADSVSFVDTRTRQVSHEVLLAGVSPSPDPMSGRFDVAVAPRALALSHDNTRLYVTGQRSSRVYALAVERAAVTVTSPVLCSEPIGVLVAADDQTIYVACSEDNEILALDAASLELKASVGCPRKPWALAWGESNNLLVSHLLGPGVSQLDPSPLTLKATWTVADGPAGADPTVPHGQVRGIYDLALRQQTSALWVAHLMLGTDTGQPTLNFQSTVFPAISVLSATGSQSARLTVSTAPQDGGAFADVVSGPHALAFTNDGRYALVVDSDSEDVLLIDANSEQEISLLRPLPGHQPEGIVVASDGTIYVHERNTSDVAVIQLSEPSDGPRLIVSETISLLAVDPMPSDLRQGQHVFYSANSDELPVTTNHWVACASCHIEGRSDAVTWRFAQGPRDTPSNAGGTLNTGFLFRLAARNRVQDYWQTINLEQGGHFSLAIPGLAADMNALERYVDLAISYPVPPRTDPTQVAAGQALFQSLGCPSCHAGAYFTDSGAQNPTLDLSGFIMLHDVGSCVTTGPWLDQPTPDENGDPRVACAFDTPTLRGIADTAPYMHDGSAATLAEVLQRHMTQPATPLDSNQTAALAAYLQSL